MGRCAPGAPVQVLAAALVLVALAPGPAGGTGPSLLVTIGDVTATTAVVWARLPAPGEVAVSLKPAAGEGGRGDGGGRVRDGARRRRTRPGAVPLERRPRRRRLLPADGRRLPDPPDDGAHPARLLPVRRRHDLRRHQVRPAGCRAGRRLRRDAARPVPGAPSLPARGPRPAGASAGDVGRRDLGRPRGAKRLLGPHRAPDADGAARVPRVLADRASG